CAHQIRSSGDCAPITSSERRLQASQDQLHVMKRLLTIAAGVVLACVSARSGCAQLAPDTIVTTRHQITIDGRVLRYTARAGRLPITHIDGDEPHGHLFFVSYTLDRAPTDPPRPIIFLWNGGPGSSSSQVHFMGFGPRIIDLGETF